MNITVSEALTLLEKLVSKMDVPKYNVRKLVWLDKHLATRNSNHKDYPQARELITYLLSKGIR